MFTGPVGPVEVLFCWPEAVLGNFYWPGAIGSPLASSPGHASYVCSTVYILYYSKPVCNNQTVHQRQLPAECSFTRARN